MGGGRYSGEEYEDQAPCWPPHRHEFGMNGTCFRCRHSRDNLISRSIETLRFLAPDAIAEEHRPKPVVEPRPSPMHSDPEMGPAG